MRYSPFKPITNTIAIPSKLWVTKLSSVMLILLALFLLAANHSGNNNSDSNFVYRTRLAFTEVLLPFLDVLSQPAKFVDSAVHNVQNWRSIVQENARLRLDNQRLLQWQSASMRINAENVELRRMLKLNATGDLNFVTARVAGGFGGMYQRAMLLSSGLVDGIQKDQIVTTPEGLVGRVIEVFPHSARVLAVTDINSRIPVIGEISREKAILTGDNSAQPILRFLEGNTTLKVGERMVTAGDGQVVPAGIVVGEVSSINHGDARISTYIDWRRLEYVQVVAHSLM